MGEWTYVYIKWKFSLKLINENNINIIYRPQCSSVPMLQLSQINAQNNQRSLFSLCKDCGAIEKVA